MSIATLPKTVRTMARLRVIIQTATRHGFGHIFQQLNLGAYIPSVDWFRRTKKKEEEPEVDPLSAIGDRLVRVCEDLGPTFIKLGQLASTRPDIVPPQVLTALERLQDDVKPFPSDVARRIFFEDTGTRVDEAFAEFTDKPFASGSIAQVHTAMTKDGEKVVVKIQRPGIENVVTLDIYVLQWLAERAEALVPELRPYRPKMLVDEFAKTVRNELDFINEASATRRFHEAFKDDPHIRTPRVRWDLTSPKVLTLEYMEGLHLRQALSGDESCDRKAIARNLSECFLRQYFELGFFHADPHPGNLLIRPPDGAVMYDFGMIGQIDDEMVTHLVIGIVAAMKKEIRVVVDVLADVGALNRDTDRQALGRDLGLLLDKYYGLPLRRLDAGTMFRELIETVRHNGVTLPADFIAVFKSLATVSGVVLQLDPEQNLVALIQPRLSELIRDRLSAKRMTRMLGISTWHLASIVKDAPRFLRDLMRGIGRGQFQVNIRHENLDYLASELDRSSNRLAFSVIMASTIMGSSMLLNLDAAFTLFGMPIRYLGFVGFGLTLFMAIGLVIAILRSGRMS